MHYAYIYLLIYKLGVEVLADIKINGQNKIKWVKMKYLSAFLLQQQKGIVVE